MRICSHLAVSSCHAKVPSPDWVEMPSPGDAGGPIRRSCVCICLFKLEVAFAKAQSLALK